MVINMVESRVMVMFLTPWSPCPQPEASRPQSGALCKLGRHEGDAVTMCCRVIDTRSSRRCQPLRGSSAARRD